MVSNVFMLQLKKGRSCLHLFLVLFSAPASTNCGSGARAGSAENRTEAASSQAARRAAASHLPPPALPAGRCAAASFFTPAPGVFFFSSSTLVLPSSFLARWAFALSSALTRPEERRDAYSALDSTPSDQSTFSRDPPPRRKLGKLGSQTPDPTRSHPTRALCTAVMMDAGLSPSCWLLGR